MFAPYLSTYFSLPIDLFIVIYIIIYIRTNILKTDNMGEIYPMTFFCL